MINIVVGLSAAYLLIMGVMFQASITDLFVAETVQDECSARSVTFAVSFFKGFRQFFSLLTRLTYL